MNDIWTYLGHLLQNGWTVLAGFMIAIEPVTRLLWHGYDEWALKRLTDVSRKKLAYAGALLAFLVATYLAFHDAKEEVREVQRQLSATTQVSQRHLMPEQHVQLITSLRAAGGTNQSVEIDSASNCDECEEYAQELREAINSVPSWKAGGETTIFGSAAIRGIKLYVRSFDNRSSMAIKLGAALDAARLKFEWIEDPSLRYDRVFVARQVRR